MKQNGHNSVNHQSGDSATVPVLPLKKNERIDSLRMLFSARYKQEPDFYVRVPGRVNLIGEHIDYCGYGVCPMALEQDIMVAVASRTDHQLQLVNQESQYEDYICDITDFEISVENGGPQWYKYFLCGVKGIMEVLSTTAIGMNVAVTGNIPQSAGLSSSSAMVSAAALTTAHINKMQISKEKLATLSAKCEKYIGTQGGGMDQAIAFLATEGCAKLIEFSPLRSRNVLLPQGAVFVIAHSLVKLNKAATADFNCRVIECRLASQILAKSRGLVWQKLQKLSDLQMAVELELDGMIQLVEDTLHIEPYTKTEVCKLLGIDAEELDKVSLTSNTRHIESFKLYQRALHVFQEALRVRQFYDQCDNKSSGESTLTSLGRLMTASHESLRDLYECSHLQLDHLVEISHKASALGARLTGAGWGGCAVALVSPDHVNEFITNLKEKFYRELGVNDQFDTLVFATAPNAGASIHYDSMDDDGIADN